MWIAWFLLAVNPGPRGHNAYATRRSTRCTHGYDLTDKEARCLLATEPSVRFVTPVTRRQMTRHPGCECSSYAACNSNGVSVRPMCGCQDFSGESYVLCYVLSNCPGSFTSTTFPGASYRPCQGPPPPPPVAHSCADPLYGQQWHLSHIRAAGAWGSTRLQHVCCET